MMHRQRSASASLAGYQPAATTAHFPASVEVQSQHLAARRRHLPHRSAEVDRLDRPDGRRVGARYSPTSGHARQPAPSPSEARDLKILAAIRVELSPLRLQSVEKLDDVMGFFSGETAQRRALGFGDLPRAKIDRRRETTSSSDGGNATFTCYGR
jgi:hypothetical protein